MLQGGVYLYTINLYLKMILKMCKTLLHLPIIACGLREPQVPLVPQVQYLCGAFPFRTQILTCRTFHLPISRTESYRCLSVTN